MKKLLSLSSVRRVKNLTLRMHLLWQKGQPRRARRLKTPAATAQLQTTQKTFLRDPSQLSPDISARGLLTVSQPGSLIRRQGEDPWKWATPQCILMSPMHLYAPARALNALRVTALCQKALPQFISFLGIPQLRSPKVFFISTKTSKLFIDKTT